MGQAMNKAQFIQHLVIRACPAVDRMPGAIAHGEALWEYLTEAGYGDKKPAEPRDVKDDYYSQLTPREADWFDRFWLAYNYKVSKQKAALRWAQLSKQQAFTDEQYRAIVLAAKKEGERDFKNTARKHPDGWLSDRRYDDNKPTRAVVKNQALGSIHALNSDLISLQALHKASGNDALVPQIDKLKALISSVMQQSSH